MIFEKIELTDGGPNDKGTTIGYLRANSREEAKIALNITHGFIQLNKIPLETYLGRKEKAIKNLEMYNLIV